MKIEPEQKPEQAFAVYPCRSNPKKKM